MTIRVLKKVSGKLLKATVKDYLTVRQVVQGKIEDMAVVKYFLTTQACGSI